MDGLPDELHGGRPSKVRNVVGECGLEALLGVKVLAVVIWGRCARGSCCYHQTAAADAPRRKSI